MIFTAGLSNLAARSRSHRSHWQLEHRASSGHRLQTLKLSNLIFITIALSLQLVAHSGTFVLLALERFFRLALMVLLRLRPSYKPDLT
jgi:hypothetical protein